MFFLITLLDNLIIILLNVVLRIYGGAERGDRLITCATVVQSFMTIVSCPAQGITTSCSTIFGYHYGRENYSKIRQAFAGVFLLCGGALSGQASSCIRMYTLALLGVAVQYALVDGLTAMMKVRYAFPLSVFRKLVYMLCIFTLPKALDISSVFYAGSISDAVGATFSLLLFICFINPKIKNSLERGKNYE